MGESWALVNYASGVEGMELCDDRLHDLLQTVIFLAADAAAIAWGVSTD